LQLRHALLDDHMTEAIAGSIDYGMRDRQIEGCSGSARAILAGAIDQPAGIAGQETRQQLALSVGDEQYCRILIQGMKIGCLALADLGRGRLETGLGLGVRRYTRCRATHRFRHELDLCRHHRLVERLRRRRGLRAGEVNSKRDKARQQHQGCSQDQAESQNGLFGHGAVAALSAFQVSPIRQHRSPG
jgi:hypothetical protein